MTKSILQRRPEEGDVFAIPLGDGTYGFGQVCKGGGSYAYFDLCSDSFPPMDEIVSRPVAFRVATVVESVKNGGWTNLGNSALTGQHSELVSYRNQPVGSNQLFLIKGNRVTPATYDEVKDLEVMSAWFGHQVVQRLIDHFTGRLNLEFESTRKIKVYDGKTGQEIAPETVGKKGGLLHVPDQAKSASQEDTVSTYRADTKRKPATATTLGKICDIVAFYDQFIVLLRDTDDERLSLYTKSVAAATADLKEMLTADIDANLGRAILKGLREGLRETPQILVRLVPDRGAQFVSELENKLGRRFSAL